MAAARLRAFVLRDGPPRSIKSAKEIKHLSESHSISWYDLFLWLNGGVVFIIWQQTLCSQWLIWAWASLKCCCRQQPSRCFITAAKTSDCDAENVRLNNPFVFSSSLKVLFAYSIRPSKISQGARNPTFPHQGRPGDGKEWFRRG